ncbi:MAG: GrpB family protein [Streptosporangiaceae bacterium]
MADPADEDACVAPPEQAGYRLTIREPGWPEHRLLKGPDTDINLHAHPPDSPETDRNLRFRDHLRADPAD